jgi:ribosomal protein S18 acetylase RimI-like enzyme
VSLLVDEVIKICQPQKITLNVYRDNHAALSLYRSLGFMMLEDQSRADAFFMIRKAEPGAALNRMG